ncbi:DUF4926 domain-containing protein [Methylobacterium trifolii]|uniref:DUF4926 domain-containing protein n=1 Tax=Methylobacterium trifolii TaxID=1003092 RepID=A0ABQ4TTK7_9HYPH|nr:DUF4926 domain-containing protein [Methylobacterium trifolii]GJE58540.1 hypothetical protein MPOCJGCO_0622 [Methylobacterium trifolii]
MPYERRHAIDALDEVTLAVAMRSDDGATIPEGSSGTVVGVWAGGNAFEVEFSEPFHALATVERAAIAQSLKAAS